MEDQTRQLLRLLADELTDRLVSELANGPVLETALQRDIPGSRQTIGRRLKDLEAWGIVLSDERSTPGKGRPTRIWWLADDGILRFVISADEFLLGLMERRANRLRQAIRGAATGKPAKRLRGL
jgi:predicted ArsR family transcriptional regulator